MPVTFADIKAIEEALAKTVDLMKYYSSMKTKYENKVKHLEIVKQARNDAQDELTAIRNELGISDDDSIICTIQALKNANETIDTQENNNAS